MLTIPRRAAVAQALQAAGGSPVSGESLAGELGISRVAVSKHVAALRVLGYEVAAAPRAGYRLLGTPDICIPEEVAPRLHDALWNSCDGGPSVSSTSDDVKRLARNGSPEGTLIVAGEQRNGRGRFGRQWISPAGGVYASFLLRPSLAPAEVSALPLVIALGAAQALRAAGVPVGLKWPNDLLVEGRKLAGILLEMAAEADRIEWVVAGIGVNVATPAEPGTARVRDHIALPVAAVAALVLDGVAASYRAFLTDGFAPLRSAYEGLLVLAGNNVTVSDLNGEVVAAGVARGVSNTGELLVDTPDGVRAIHAGEVTLRR